MGAETPSVASLIRLIETLRGKNGCPWDRKQTPESLSVYLVEEVYELVDAIASGNADAVCEELGDVLFQVLFVARLFEETGQFTLADTAEKIAEKMVRRHPHVFGSEHVDSTDDIRIRWHEIKKTEKAHAPMGSVLDSVPTKLPALMRAYRVSERAARTGFDWSAVAGVVRKAEEEWEEFNSELRSADADPDDATMDRAALEFGDVLFTLVNVARLARIHPETALTRATRKFEKRFRHMEQKLAAAGRDLESATREELDRLWEAAKQETGTGRDPV